MLLLLLLVLVLVLVLACFQLLADMLALSDRGPHAWGRRMMKREVRSASFTLHNGQRRVSPLHSIVCTEPRETWIGWCKRGRRCMTSGYHYITLALALALVLGDPPIRNIRLEAEVAGPIVASGRPYRKNEFGNPESRCEGWRRGQTPRRASSCKGTRHTREMAQMWWNGISQELP
ncbi:hypothetical protein K431DRAFT_57497 [Polychaeton citri CBS 116435]|uniref:Secreted protein n=1 Tax=Polychaeton citri CBS 116435 TaxID=1314669 RepID=A0A9P4QCJ8_9PEZI|nr:hypothetical protein K431DRAFT_57497 [Polychaeton citri CBS 116435]